MKVLVTGGAGFIGSHTVEALIAAGHQVTVLDDLSTGNIERISENVAFVRASILERELLFKAVADQDAIIHLAAYTSVPESFCDHQRCFQINVEGTFHLLDAAVAAGLQRIVFASSSAVYADEVEGLKSEFECPQPGSPYAVSKLEGEHLLNWYSQRYGISYIAYRYFNVYGPRQQADSDYAAAIPIFVECGLTSQPMTIYGDGLQTRDFVFVKDVARANVAAVESSHCGIYNIGTGIGTGILSLAKVISRLSGSCAGWNFADHRPGDVGASEADLNYIQKKLGWRAETELERGLEMTVEWHRASVLRKRNIDE